MNAPQGAAPAAGDLPPLQRLLIAYAPAALRPWQALCWALDQRLAAIARRGGDPTIAAIRLAWWDAVLVEGDRAKGGGEPLVEQWRAWAPPDAPGHVGRLIDGWRLLVSPEPMSEDDLCAYGRARGGGLSGLLAAGEVVADAGAAIAGAGDLWALWDLAAHVQDAALAARALQRAADLARSGAPQICGPALRPLRLARAVALPDIRAGRIPASRFTLRQYGRLLRASLSG
jgi:phytoene synthase